MHANRFRGYYGIPPGGFTVPQGGTKDLAFIHLPSLGVVGGIAQADEFGLVNRSNLNTDYTTDWTTLTGPKTGRRGLACNYQITNYGFKRTYVVSSDSGQVSVQDDVVTFVPDVSGWVNFTVNGRKFDVLVNTENIQKPTINKIVYSTDEGGEISMSLSPFRVFEGSDFHLSSDFQLSYQANFGDNLLVDKKQQPASQPNFVLSGFQTESVVYARALVDGIQFGSTDWGPTRIYQIPRVIDGNLPNQSGGSIDETAVSLVIPAGGSITITTDSGFNQTYTSSQNIDIPVGSSIVTIVGHGTNGSTTQNPGQIAISPSGPIYEEQAIPTAMIMLQGMNFPLTGFAKTVFSDEQVILGFGAKNVVTHHVTPIGKEVIVGYLNPGQPYIAPFTQRTNGLPSVVSLQGNVYTFPGGIGEAATVLTRTHFLLLTTIVDNGGTLNPVSVVTTIGGNGSVSLSTEKGFAETVTSSKTSTVPAGSNVLTIKGRGGNGGTVSNPGQSYIAPSGPVYKTETTGSAGQPYIAPSGAVYRTETTNNPGQPYIAPSGPVYKTETTGTAGQPYIAPSGPVYKTVTTGSPGQPYIAPSDPVYKTVVENFPGQPYIAPTGWVAGTTGVYAWGSPVAGGALVYPIGQGPSYSSDSSVPTGSGQQKTTYSGPSRDAGYNSGQGADLWTPYTSTSYTVTAEVSGYYTNPGQEYIASTLVSTEVLDYWTNPGQPYIASTLVSTQVLDYYTNPGQPYIASTLVSTQVLDYYTNPGQAYIAPTSSGSQVFDYWTNPGQPYIASTLVTTQVLDYYTNPGQPYIAPSNSSSTGASTSVTVMGQLYSFPGGIGIPSVEVTKTHLLTSNSSSTSGFGTSLSVTRDAGLLIIGTPSSETTTSSQPGAIAIYDIINDNPVLKNRFFSETPPSSVVLSIPSGGSVQIKTAGGLDQTLTTSQTFTIPASSGDVTFIGKGGPGSYSSNPGQPYIAPSGPVYTTVTTGQAGQPYIAPSGAVYRTETTNNPGQPYIAPSGPVYRTETTGSAGQYYIAPSDPVYRTETVTDPGQAYIAPSGAVYKKGPLTIGYTPMDWAETAGYTRVTYSPFSNLDANGNPQNGSSMMTTYWQDYGNYGVDADGPESRILASFATFYYQQELSEVDYYTNPGQAYIAPSTTSTQVFDHYANPGQPYIASTINTTQVLDHYTNPGQAYIAPTSSGSQVFDHWTDPGQAYIASTLTSSQVLDYYSNPGQAYIAPSSASTTGTATTLSFKGRTITFPGGVGTAATPQTQQVLGGLNNSLGQSVFATALGNHLFAGAPNDFQTYDNAGSVYRLYKETDGNWKLGQRIVSPTPLLNAVFGYQVTANEDGSRLFISSVGENAVYYFKNVAGVYTFQQKIQASDTPSTGFFGESITCDALGNTLVIGASTKASGSNFGAVYIFTTTDGVSFGQQTKLVPTTAGTTLTYVVPATGELQVKEFDSSGVLLLTSDLSNSGTLTLNSLTRTLQTRGAGAKSSVNSPTKITYDGVEYVYPSAVLGKPDELFIDIPRVLLSKAFGGDVGISANGLRIWVSAPQATSRFSEQGVVFNYKYNGTIWKEGTRLTSLEPAANGNFGKRLSVADTGSTVVIGDPTGNEGMGMLCMVTEEATGNYDVLNLVYKTLSSLNNFGREVGISGNGYLQLASNPKMDNDRGAVYLFNS